MLEEYKYEGLAADDRWQNQEVLVNQHPVTTRARRGDLIRVVRYVEDRHGLHVRAFRMTLQHELKGGNKNLKNCSIS